jgi:sterol desaturase/sphingolipid hydroxylase (fatty acid hydroxylase superfamily)
MLSRMVVVDYRAEPRRAIGVSAPSLAIATGTAAVAWFGAVTLERSGSLGLALSAGREELVGPALLALVVTVLLCERVWPAERRSVLARGHVQDACFFLLYASLVVPLMTLMGVAFGAILGTHAAWIEAPWTASWPRWVVVAVTLVAMDGANWLAHWADHRFTAFWRFHAVHHSQEELSVLTSFRAHPLVHTIGFMLATVPVIALTGLHPLAPILITVYLCLGTLTHANVTWTFGPAGRVFVSPAYHRLHHSVDCPPGGNLGVVLTVWDQLSGHSVFPRRGDAPCATGLAGRPLNVEQMEPGRRAFPLLIDQLREPFAIASGSEDRAGRR